ncbi:MAG: hypothetical protein NTV12_03305, partial [Verrucomicrobia bacterium]|nr:hypothetical protein [Verrucomicrobiota bacterium]
MIVWLCLMVDGVATLLSATQSHHLHVEISPKFFKAPLSFDALTNKISSGQQISVTRLDFLISNIALRRSDGTWLTQPNRFAYVSAREGHQSFRV